MAPIHHAARRGDVEQLRRFLAQGYSPNAIQWMGGDFEPRRTPLHVLCRDCKNRSGRVACFKLLRDAGANLGATDAVDYTPLHHSASRSDVEIVSLLIQAGVNVNVTSRDGFTPLHEAARSLIPVGSAADCVDLLLKAGAAVNVKASGWTPLALEINGGHRRMLPLFLRAGAEIPGYYSPMPNPYILRVERAGGFEKYAQAHRARVTKIFESTLGLDARPARLVAEFWLLHAGYY